MGRKKTRKPVKQISLQRQQAELMQQNLRGRKSLSQSDEKLWAQVAQTVRPLSKQDLYQKQIMEEAVNSQYKAPENVKKTAKSSSSKKEQTHIKTDEKTKLTSVTEKPLHNQVNRGSISILQSLLPESLRTKKGKQVFEKSASYSQPVNHDSCLNRFDRSIYRKIERGRVDIDARIDLHGYTQNEAYYELLYFVQQAYVQGMRHILIITGKGKSYQSQGVLQKQLPYWMATPTFQIYIAAVQKAARPHGGEGAYYVRLRKLES